MQSEWTRLAGLSLAAIAGMASTTPAAARSICPDGSVIPFTEACPPSVANSAWTILYDYDRTALTTEARDMLDQVVTTHRQVPSGRIQIMAHTDRSGPAAYNVGLSQRFGSVVRDYLTAHGVPGNRISVEAYGESRPAVETPDGVREPLNRRAEIRFIIDRPVTVYFEWDTSNLTAQARGQLDGFVTALQAGGPGARVIVAGHTDRSRTADYAVGLSQRMANSVRDYLVDRGVAPRLISTIAYGENRPVVETRDGVREALNRRAVVSLILD